MRLNGSLYGSVHDGRVLLSLLNALYLQAVPAARGEVTLGLLPSLEQALALIFGALSDELAAGTSAAHNRALELLLAQAAARVSAPHAAQDSARSGSSTATADSTVLSGETPGESTGQ